MSRAQRVELDGASLAVEVSGPAEGPPVVLVHAFPLSGRMWDDQVQALAGEYRVLVPDLRGFGQSRDDGFPRTLERYVDDLLATLDAFESRPPVLVGLSMGGYVVLRARERAPGRVRGLVLADTRSTPDDDEGLVRRAAAVESLRSGGVQAFARSTATGLLGETTLRTRPDIRERVEAMIRANDPRGIAAAAVAMACRTDTSPGLGSVDVPTLVMVGEQDALTPPEQARALAGAIPGARVAVLRGAGHLSNLESPEAFSDTLLGFLRGVR